MAIEIRFEWDERKADANRRKHGISFAAASRFSATPSSREGFKVTNMEKPVGRPSARLEDPSFTSRTPRTKKAKAKPSASSRRAKQPDPNVVRIKGIPKMTAEMLREIEEIKKMPDDQIDLTDMPEFHTLPGPTYVGLFPPSRNKKSVTIRLDEDMVRWFKKQGKGWQTKMNWVLRLYFASHRKTGVKVGRP